MAEKSKNHSGVVLLALAAILVFFWLIGELSSRSSPKISDPITSTSGNPAQDSLMSMTPERQALLLAAAVGDGCQGQDPFYMGSSGLTAMWSVRCSDGRSYGVEIKPDAGGSTKILTCSEMEMLAHTRCFTKLSAE